MCRIPFEAFPAACRQRQKRLATLHKFQGFADAFLTTPAGGLRDLYLKAEYRWLQTSWGDAIKVGAAAHDFQAEEGGADLGSEVDVFASLGLAHGVLLETKAAFFDGGGAGPADRTKVWLALDFRL